MTRADFQSCGILPLSMDIWNRCDRPGASSSVASLSNLLGLLSGQVALWGLMSFSSFRTPLMLNLIGGTLGVLLGPRSGRSHMSSLVKTEQKLFTHDICFVQTVGEGKSVLLQRSSTRTIFLSGLDEVPKSLRVSIIVCQHVAYILIVCNTAGFFGACFLSAFCLVQPLGSLDLLTGRNQRRFSCEILHCLSFYFECHG